MDAHQDFGERQEHAQRDTDERDAASKQFLLLQFGQSRVILHLHQRRRRCASGDYTI